MKERSVNFYKRLIIFTALFVILVVATLLTFFIGKQLNLWGSAEGKAIDNGDVVTALSSSNGQNTTKSGIEKQTTGEALEITPIMPAVPLEKTEGPTGETAEDKVVYLTFDDGASVNTPEILKILKENNINATFFFNTGQSGTTDEIISAAYKDGNAVGILTSKSYRYDTIYDSVENYLEDFNKSYERIYQVTGEKPDILRFPGGSINNYDKHNYKDLIKEVTSRGLVYYDWNVCAEDGSRKTSLEAMVQHATKLPKNKNKCIVLMHDNGNDNTCEALKEVIQFYRDNGYVFDKLTADVEPIIF